MSTNAQTAVAPAQAPSRAMVVQQQRRVTLRHLFEQQRPELVKLLPKGMDPDRLFRMSLTECIKNPDLLECTAESWALAVQTCAQQGLYPDSGLGYMYLVPRNNRKKGVKEVSAMRGYQGDIRLARNSGEIADIYAEVVYARDTYKVRKGLDRTIIHEPYDGDEDPGPLKSCYAVAKLTTGEIAFVTLTKADVMRHRASSDGADSDFSPWKKHEAAMWKKTAIHELAKWLPKSTERAEAIARQLADEKPVDVTPLSAASVPAEPASGLEGLTARLEHEEQQAAAAESGQAATSDAEQFGPECAGCGKPTPPCDAQDDEGRAFHGPCLEVLKKQQAEDARRAAAEAKPAPAGRGQRRLAE